MGHDIFLRTPFTVPLLGRYYILYMQRLEVVLCWEGSFLASNNKGKAELTGKQCTGEGVVRTTGRSPHIL